MITNLKIDNFKSLKHIDVGFGSLNFIVGPNASGKTNLAEALDFLSHAIREDLAYAVSEKEDSITYATADSDAPEEPFHFRSAANSK